MYFMLCVYSYFNHLSLQNRINKVRVRNNNSKLCDNKVTFTVSKAKETLQYTTIILLEMISTRQKKPHLRTGLLFKLLSEVYIYIRCKKCKQLNIDWPLKSNFNSTSFPGSPGWLQHNNPNTKSTLWEKTRSLIENLTQ